MAIPATAITAAAMLPIFLLAAPVGEDAGPGPVAEAPLEPKFDPDPEPDVKVAAATVAVLMTVVLVHEQDESKKVEEMMIVELWEEDEPVCTDPDTVLDADTEMMASEVVLVGDRQV